MFAVFIPHQSKKNLEVSVMKIFGKDNKMVREAKLPTPIVPEEETFAPVEYDYGLDKVERVLKSGDSYKSSRM